MGILQTLPPAGFVVIVVIAALFILAVALLFAVCGRYRRISGVGRAAEDGSFHGALLKEYTAAYEKYGKDVNTPAIISSVVGSRLSKLLLCERFLNNAVSLFVTLGLFGTFLGLSLSVASLTKLIGLSNTDQWLNVLDSVGGGLISALSGMGVAFYTSLVGAGCSILLTILRTIFSPQAAREQFETRLELWLDDEVAPTLGTVTAKDDASLVRAMVDAMGAAAAEIRQSLLDAAARYGSATAASAASFRETLAVCESEVQKFNAAIATFKEGVHDFSEVDYNLRGSVERMDLAVRDLSAAMREINRRMEGARQ